MDTPQHTGEGSIPWHPAFYQAIQLELAQYKDILHYEFEHQLTAEPLRMDVLIIKKEKDVVIKKNIASIFKAQNIVEYKSPDDYVSVDDFYKVYGYACLYAALNKAPVTDLTISFIESRYPRELIKHLEEVRNYRVEEKSGGIYRVRGDFIPIQIIDSKKLRVDENRWLKDLNHEIERVEFKKLSLEVVQQGLASQIGAYINAVYLANWPRLEEELMGDAAMNFERVLKNAGLIAKWKAEGKAEGEFKGKLEMAQYLVNVGWTVEQVVDASKLDVEKVRALYPR
ncbi:hypothetical protein AGMMS49546_39450 [Spirochaetia bacterium]|nr:hypothetical protein AGMMS49546_39450 [Spirochaetia bacterium]